ncbi:hypothetical protein HHI36_020410 [Cryptolaemus montrouzieri]|uniref:Uncharacterized protein n=1 Tax=Cryptolaemus montrouzieri TaxID=559131 RepID=A0ABD2NAP0_9CUCU
MFLLMMAFVAITAFTSAVPNHDPIDDHFQNSIFNSSEEYDYEIYSPIMYEDEFLIQVDSTENTSDESDTSSSEAPNEKV